MKKFVTAAVVAAGLSTAIGLSAPSQAAPTTTGTAQQTIDHLQSQGYRVIVGRLSDVPLDRATVVSIGEGPTFSHTRSGARNRDDYTDYDRQFMPMNQMTIHLKVR
jgi:hypothetical protein